MTPQVLIVGAGPVGLTMAAELARYRIAVRIIDKAPHRSEHSKALVVWPRTLELMDRMPCSDAFISAGLKAMAMNIVAGGHPIARVPLDAIPSPYPFALMLPQSETERFLEEHLATLGVSVERECELLHFTASNDTVSANLKYSDGREENLRTSWLIGCDGAHSTVRHGLGIQFEGDTLPSDFVLADVHLSGVRTPPNELALFWHAQGVLGFFPISAGRYRIIADIGEAKTPDKPPDPTLAELQTILDQRGPGGIVASSPLWLASFRINERKVADYRAGRVFLAGDAAHIHSPAGGQGMNTGMQDAFNLAWKLAMVIHNLAKPEPLLSSYSAERSEVGRQVLRDAGRMTTLAILRGGIAQEIRNHLASLILGFAPIRRSMATRLSEISIGYPHSPLTRSENSGADPAAGARAPLTKIAAPIGSGSTPRFVLFSPDAAAAAAIINRYSHILEPKLRPPFSNDGIWLVRPDGYVAITTEAGKWVTIADYLNNVIGDPDNLHSSPT